MKFALKCRFVEKKWKHILNGVVTIKMLKGLFCVLTESLGSGGGPIEKERLERYIRNVLVENVDGQVRKFELPSQLTSCSLMPFKPGNGM